jgi:hypothetical protein
MRAPILQTGAVSAGGLRLKRTDRLRECRAEPCLSVPAGTPLFDKRVWRLTPEWDRGVSSGRWAVGAQPGSSAVGSHVPAIADASNGKALATNRSVRPVRCFSSGYFSTKQRGVDVPCLAHLWTRLPVVPPRPPAIPARVPMRAAIPLDMQHARIKIRERLRNGRSKIRAAANDSRLTSPQTRRAT